ncbi:MAG: type 2 lantipeptide synthetase LanM [Verrucomicrobia bacterium]|nr:type 2 lantipeptide synthetase LanM [Verrucomicrobiota bacterium]
MRFRNSWRAQYYLASLEKAFSDTIAQLSTTSLFKKDVSEILCEFSLEVAEELDQLLLPTLVHELHRTKQLGGLAGSTPSERYTSFFVKEHSYTAQARSITDKYPYLFEMIDAVIVQSFLNLRNCLKRLEKDLSEIKRYFKISSTSLVEKVKILSSSDRHRDQQSLLLFFSDNTKIIYKPVDLHLDDLFEEFIKEIDLPDPFDLLCRKTLSKDNYGWLEYISQQSCHSIEEVRLFYQKSGVFLAIADTLNYSDGHCENILAHGSFPILLDGETLFQNYAMPLQENKSIISTQLIQKFTKNYQNKTNYSAFQATDEERFESLFTHAIHDQTDDIRISYSGYSHESTHHRPSFQGNYYNSSEFLEDILRGFCFCYDLITEKSLQILKHLSWWDKISSVHSRMVIRDTSAYFYLQRRIQQPEYCKSKKKAEDFLRSKLRDTPYTDYEVQDLLALNIPYFYHKPGETYLYDGKNHCYSHVFPNTAIDWIKKHLTNRSEDKKLHDCRLIRKYLRKKANDLATVLS